MTVSRVTQETAEAVSDQVAATARATQDVVEVVSRQVSATARITQVVAELVSPNVADDPAPSPTGDASALLIVCT